MTVHVRFWGTRGSVPAPGPQTVRYGGNTPCVELRMPDGRLVILDAGTGIRELGRALLADAVGSSIEADIFLSHAHWDHIQGLPFFAPIFSPGNRFTIWGSHAAVPGIERAVREQMSATVFPVPFDELKAAVEFRPLAQGTYQARGYQVRALPVQHPGGALGFRFTPNGQNGAVVYIPDNELGPLPVAEEVGGGHAALMAFAAGARVLVHDATYTAAEYEQHRGWGHSAYDDVVRLALEARVEQLVLFHHHPDRTDDELENHLEACRALARANRSSMGVVAAAEGMTLTI